MFLEYAKIPFDIRYATKLSENEWQINLNNPIPIKENTFAGVPQIVYTNSFKGINSNNNKFQLIEYDGSGLNPETINITIPEGNYSVTNLASTLKSLLDNASYYTYTYTVTHDSVTSHFTIVNSSNKNFDLEFNVPNSAYLVMGFNKDTYEGRSTNSYTITSENIVRLDGSIDTIYIICDSLACSGFFDPISGGSSQSILTNFQRIGSYFDQVYYNFENPMRVAVTATRLQTIRVKLLNQDFEPISFQAGSSFSFLLVLYEVYK
jgi:hypothetical protein